LITRFAPASSVTKLDCSRLGALDTAGAQLLVQLVGPNQVQELASRSMGLDRSRIALLDAISQAVTLAGNETAKSRHRPLTDLAGRVGAAVVLFGTHTRALLGFIGLVLESLARTALRPSRWRITPVVAQLEQIGLNALPIVALLNFMVGAVIAFLGATVLIDFGANAYTVDLVGFSFLREFGILIASILLAGRTASAFTAQIGSMKANQEIDAIQALDLDYVELLVLPRVLAMLLALPILTFVAMICGIAGGALVCIVKLDIPLAMFISRFRADIPVEHFLVGISKAPPFAFLIACIGCVEGLSVSGSAQSVGQHTTSSVVQSIFVVILLDAVAALFFMEMGW
jgi:phospholipid/cholesterol/gamma-HCH transport system permease protein